MPSPFGVRSVVSHWAYRSIFVACLSLVPSSEVRAEFVDSETSPASRLRAYVGRQSRDLCEPWWVRRNPSDTVDLAVVTAASDANVVRARELAAAKAPVAFVKLVSQFIEGPLTTQDESKLRATVGAFASGAREIRSSAHCRGVIYVWSAMPVSMVVGRIVMLDEKLGMRVERGLRASLRAQMELAKPEPGTNVALKALLLPSLVQFSYDRPRRGAFVLTSIVAGVATAKVAEGRAGDAERSAFAATNDAAARDYYNRRVNNFNLLAQVGWAVAGAGYVFGVLDATSARASRVRFSVAPNRLGVALYGPPAWRRE